MQGPYQAPYASLNFGEKSPQSLRWRDGWVSCRVSDQVTDRLPRSKPLLPSCVSLTGHVRSGHKHCAEVSRKTSGGELKSVMTFGQCWSAGVSRKTPA